MLSEIIIKRLDTALEDYSLESLKYFYGISKTSEEIDEIYKLFEDKNYVINVFSKDVGEFTEDDKSFQQKIARLAVSDKDVYLDKYRSCKTLGEFKYIQSRDINRKFLFDLYTFAIGNLSVEELEKKYYNDNSKKKGLI